MRPKSLLNQKGELPLCPCLLTVLLTWSFYVQAQDPVQPTPTPPDPLAGVPVQVIQQQQVTIGSQTITFNRISPPAFPAPTPTPMPSVAPKPQMKTAVKTVKPAAKAPAKQITRYKQDATTSGSQIPDEIFAVSATVYDHQFTEVSWPSSGNGDTGLQVFVNFDFNYLSTLSSIQTSSANYQIIMGLGNDTADSLIQAGVQPPNLSTFPAGYSSYQVIAGNTTNHANDLAALSAVCAYYDANQAQLIAAYQQQQATQAAQQQWLQTHPPVQPNTVVDFWPVKSSVYPTVSR